MIRENSQRAKNVIIFFWVLFGITVISIVSSFMEHRLLVRGSITIDEANANDLRQRIIAIIETIIRVIVIIYFIMWFRRAYFNLQALGCSLRYTEGWAAGAWFVPIMNLYAPFQVMKDIWNKTQERAQQQMPGAVIESSAILGFWWFLWIVGNIAGNIYTRLAFQGEHSISDLLSLNVTGIVLNIIDLVNIFLIITIVKKVNGFEERLKESITIENIASEEQSLSPVAG